MLTTTIKTGGIDTIEVGSISGDIDVSTTVVDGHANVTVAYTGALDVYTVVGSGLAATGDEAAAQSAIAAHLSRDLGRDENGNVPSASLSDLVL